MKKIAILLVTVIGVFSCTPEKYNTLSDGLYAEIKTNKGDILLELYAKDVPMTVANFVSLAEGENSRVETKYKDKPFYDGLTFHRVVDNFVIQGGDPLANGKGNPGYFFGDEFPKDKNSKLLYSHNDAGILSMANSGPNRNGSQFFITHNPLLHLDGKHSVFGKTRVNSNELRALQKSIKDAVALEKAIDSVRMITVNAIEANDTIKSVKIIRIGSDAKSFEADEVFNQEIVKFNRSAEERKKQEQRAEEIRYSKYLENKAKFLQKMDEAKATKTDSGLGFLLLKPNSKGKKVPDNKPVKAHFTLYTADGNRIQSTEENSQAFVFQLNDAQKPMITGFKEGAAMMREGEKARLFIPYYIGFGAAAYGPFPAKSDLVFEIEILEISK